VWAEESYNASIKYAYAGIQEEGTPSPKYLEIGQQVAKERLVLAGYRLAQLFEAAYKTQTAKVE